MVAVVSGAGLGLFGSSVSALGGTGASGNAGLGRGTDRAFVNTATGNLVVQSQDDVLSALGLDLTLIRTYNSQGLLDDDNGDNWRLGVHQRVFGLTGTLNAANSTIKKTFGDGREVLYTYDASRSAYVSTEGDGAHDTLSYNAGTTQWTWTDGSARNTEVYNSSGQLLQSRDADLNTVTYTYTGGLLTQIADQSGQTTFLDYTGTNLTQVRVVSSGQTQTLTRYTYDGSNRLSQVTVDLSPADNVVADGQVYTTTYTYESTSRRIASITQTDGSSVAFTYQLIDGQYRVKTYTDAEGRLTTFNYSQASTSGGGSPVSAPANMGVLSTTDTQTVNTNYNLNSGALSTTDTVTTTQSYNRNDAVLSTTDTQPVTNTYNLNTGVLTTPPGGGWSPASLLGANGITPQLKFDANGNGMAIWKSSFTVYASSYSKATGVWSAPVTLIPSVTTDTSFATDAAGNAVVAWLSTTATSATISARRYDGTTGSWGVNETVQFYSDDGGSTSGIGPSEQVLGGGATTDGASVNAAVPTISDLRVAINGTKAAVSWCVDFPARVVVARLLSGTSWFPEEISVPPPPGLNGAFAPQLAIDSLGNVLAVYTQKLDTYVQRFDVGSATWSSGLILDSTTIASTGPQVAVDANGNALVIWQENNDVVSRRYTRSTNTWAAAVALDSVSNAISWATLSMDAAGNAVAAWVQSDGTAASVYANRFNVATGTWGTATLLESASTAVATTAGALSVSINGSQAAVAWLQTDGTRNNGWVARFNGTSWLAAANVESSTTAVANITAAIDGQGNVTVLMDQGGVQQARYSASGGTPYYLIPSGATWQSVANTLYGINSAAAGTALQTALGNPPLTAGNQLTNLSATLSVTTTQTVTVPPYYTIPSGATWQSLANTLYGVNSTAAGTALQTALGNPSIAAGNRLTSLPVTLSVTTTQTVTVPPYYTIPAGATWQSLANTLYGINSAAAGTALQTALGNPALSAGNRLTNLPATLTVTTTQTVTVPAYYTVAAGNSWTTITQAIYNTSDANAIAALQAATSNPTLTTGLKITVPLTLSYTPVGSGGSTLYLQTDVIDALGLTTTYLKDTAGRLTSVLSPTVGGTRLETRYAYDTDGNILTVTEDPAGLNRVTTFSYDTRGNLLSSRDSLGNTVTRTYNSNNQLLSETRYLVPDPDGAGSGQPGTPLTTRYAYDGENHLRFVISAQGRVTEHAYNTPGQRTATLKYTGALYGAANFTENDLVTWSNTQDRTRLERTDYTYDFRGNLATLRAYLSTDASGNGTGTPLLTQFVYDQRGQLLQTIEARGSATVPNPATPNLPYATTYVYDGLGRVKQATQWISGTSAPATITTYDDANRKTTITLANGLVTTRLFNRAGELISLSNGTASVANSLGTTTYAYDADGRLRIVTDPTLVRQFYFYDEAGRKAGFVDSDGTLTEYVYNKANALIKTIQYAAAVNATTLASLVDGSGNPTAVTLATVRTAAGGQPTQDRITRNVYDIAARLVYSIDEIGAVTQYFYDGAGRVTDTVRYTNPVTIARTVDQLLPGDITITAVAATDRRTRYFYDSDGKLAGKLDAEGYLVEYLYDPAGYLFQQIAYATQTNASFWLAGTLTQLRPAVDTEIVTTPERDIVSYFFYDRQGRRIGALDGEGYLTEIVYDAAGHGTQTNRWNRKLTYAATPNPFQTLRDAATAAPAVTVHTTTCVYDGAGRKTQETDYQGVVTTYKYDDVGNLVSMTRAASTGEARTTDTIYDFLGRVLRELSAEGRAALDAISNPTPTQITDIWNKYGVTYEYDLGGRRVAATVRPNDTQTNKTAYYYDNDGRLRFEVNVLGERKEYRYNALGQLTDELAYTNRISTTGLNGGLLNATLITTLTGSTSTQDALTTYTYTLTGQVASKRTVRTSSSTEDALTSYTYNAFGERRVQTDSIDATATLATDLTFDRRGLVTQTRWDQALLNITEARQYDAFGRLKQITDGRLNVVKRFEYDTLGREVAHTESATSDRTVTTYDAFSRVMSVRDALNNTTTYGYNDTNRSMTLTTPEGVVVTTTFNRHGQKLTVVAAGNTATYAYDLNGKLTSVSDSLSAGDGRPLESHTYDRGGRELTRIDARGTTISYSYDAANRVFQRTEDSAGGGLALLTTYTYDGQGRITRVDEPNGRRTDTSYYRDGRIDTVAVDPTVLNLRTRYTYDRTGRVVTVTEGYGSTAPSKPRVTQYIYDKLGRRTEEVVDPTALGGTLNLRTQYLYDKSSNLTRKIDARNNSTWYVYDADNRVTHTIDALGGVTLSTYDAEDGVIATRRYAASIPSATVAGFGNIVTTANFSISTGTLDRVSRSFFDRDGREKYTINAAGTVTERVFDANGQVARTRVLVSPALTGTYADAAAVTTALGTAATTIGGNDRITWTAYDLRGRAAYSVDGLGKVTRYAYDPNGNVVSKAEFATPRVTTLAMDFTALNTAYGSSTPAGQDRYTRYWYDATDRLRFTLDAEGYLTEQQYNDAGRLETTIRYAAKPTVPSTATLAHLVNRTNGVVIPTDVNVDQKTISAYDAAGRLSRVTDAFNNYEEYTYDAVGNKLTYRNKKNSVWDYEYDANRRLTKEIAPSVAVAIASETASAVSVPASTNVRLETVIAYDALGNVTSRTEAANTTKARQTRYEYDALGRQTITRFPAVDVYSTSGDTQLGNGAAISRTEAPQNLFSEVAYDALGNAFRNLDVAGNYSFKIYDVLGRVEYEIDAEKYVTQYGYDGFGNKTTTKRYAQPLTGALSTTSTSLTSSALTGILVATAAEDRIVTSTYDRLNRVTQVQQQPSVSNFEPNNGSSGGTTFSAGAQTLTDYNAFGDVTRARRLVNQTSGTYADTYFYYDRRGLKTAQVDPLKFLTIYEYDETGDLKRQVEYATALAGTVNFSGYGTATVTTPATAPGSSVGYDRETLYAYDRLNRKVSETRVGVEHATISGTTVSTATGNQVTTYGYDVLGNQTRMTQVGVLVNGTATDLHSYTYYDVLGRVIATVQPTRNLGDAANTLRTPLTVMRVDAFGNIVEQIEYANGAAGTPNEAALPTPQTVDATKDRMTRMTVDSHGRVTHTEDAKSADRLASYNARGELVKEWQAVTNVDGTVEWRVTLYKYDNLGRQIDVIEPQRYVGATTVQVTNHVKYNAFGEVIERGIVDGTASSGKQEFFHYDAAGRLWRTNSGDGVTKVYLHDLAGNVTAEIRSQGRNLADNVAYANAAAVGALTTDVMRTETRYDSLGHVVEQRLPTFNTTSGLESIAATFTIGQVAGPSNPEAVYQRINTPAGVFYIVNPSAGIAQNGGYYLSASGQYVQDTSQQTITATRITWDAPTDASVEAKFEYRVLGSTDPNAWASVPVGILTSNRLSANVSSLMNQTYQYRVSYRRRTQTTAYAEATGQFRIDGTISGSQSISQNPPDPASEVATLNVTHTGGMLVWAAPGDTTVVATFRVRPTGGSSFADITATRITGGNFQADARSALATAGTYDYEIVYTRNGVTIAKKVGTLTSSGNTTPRTVINSSIQDLTYIPPTDAVPTPTVQLGGNVGAQIVTVETSSPGPRPAPSPNPGNPKPINWSGQNEVRLQWANQGAGTFTVQFDYMTSDWSQWVWMPEGIWDLHGFLPISKTQPSSGTAAATATGATIIWSTPDGPAGGGGITTITAVRVYKNGVLQFSQSNPTAVYGRGLTWARPQDANVVPRFEYAVAGSGAWTDGSILNNTTTLGVDLNGLPPNVYDYRITYRIGGRLTAQQTGTLNVGASSLTVTPLSNVTNPAVAVPITNTGDGLSWNFARQNGADSVRVTYWVDNVPQTTIGNATTFALSFASITAGGQHSVTYVIDYLRPDETSPYAFATGILRFTVSYPTVNATITLNSQTPVYPSGMQQIAAPTDLGSNSIGWTTSAVAGANVVFRYQRAAGGAWTELPEEVNGSGFKVNVQSIISGLFNYEILYTRSGETNPYARAAGTLNVTRNASPTSSSVTPNSPTAPTTIAVTPTQRQTIDRWGNVIALTDASSNTTNYRYNQYGQLVETRAPSVGYKSTLNGQVTIGTAAPITRNYYDRAGRLIAIQDANSNLTRATLNAAGQVLAETHADGGIKRSTYDGFGQVVAVEDELLFETRNTYDIVGNLTSVAREVALDGFTTPDPDDVVTDTYAYDEAGRRLSETNPENEITRYYYDLHDNLVRRRSHLNANTIYGYDASDRKVSELDPISGLLTWTYDYFGRMSAHTDLGGANYTYSYTGNWAGLLQAQTTNTGQNVSFVYDGAGHLTQINDAAILRNVTYSYDAAGRRSREKTKINGLTYQDTFIQYDALNRISRSTDLRYDSTYHYDLQSNRTNIVANYYDHERRLQTQDLWYAYDNMNRVTISQGANAFGQIGTNTTQGVRLTYNVAGQRTSSETYGKLKFRHESIDDMSLPGEPHFEDNLLVNDFTLESYEYDGLGRLTKTWREAEDYRKLINTQGQVVINSTTPTTVRISSREYDKASRETKETSQGIENDDLIARERTTVYNDDGQLDTQTTRRQDPGMGWQTESIVDYNYDAANVLRTYTVDVWKTGPLSPGPQYRSTYSNVYRLGESYQDAGQSVSSAALVGGAQVPQSGSTTRSYNVNGELISFTDTKGAEKSRYFANGVGGQPLLVVQGNISNVAQAFADALSRADNSQKSQHFFFANGQAMGSFGQLQDADGKFKANFDVNYTPISDDYPSSVPVSVVAQDNDTLRSIAARVFGDQNLWYVLAEENGLTDPDAVIDEGTVIQVPNEVLSLSNSSSSFKPFNIADAIGDTSPTQPAPPQPKKKGCGVLGQILMVVVAIVVTYFTAGATSGFFAGAFGSTGGAIATAATAAAAGSAVSQGVGIAIGAQDSFSWKSVATAALTAGVTQGIGLESFNLVNGSTAGAEFVNAAARGLAANAIGQGVNIAVGLQQSFSWRDLAISAVSAPIANKVGDKVGAHFEGRTSSAFATSVASGAASAVVRTAFGGKVDAQTVLGDIFGNALGNSIVDRMAPLPAQTERELTPHERRMQGGDTYEHQRRLASGEYVPPMVSLPEFDLELDNNPDFLANLALPTAEFETDIFGGTNPFAGARLVNSYDDAVRSFDQRLLSGIDAAARAPQAGPYIQFDPAYVDQQIAARAARNTPAAKLGMTEGEYGELVSQRQTDAASREYFLRHPDASNPFGAVGGWQAGLEKLGEGATYVGGQALVAAYQPIGQAFDLGELAVAGAYNLFSEDTYELTGFSRLSYLAKNGGSAGEIWREGLSYSPLTAAPLGGFDLGYGLATGDPLQAVQGGLSATLNLAAIAALPIRSTPIGAGTTTVFRVEGAPNTRLLISETGEVTITGDQTLFLNFGQTTRAEEFLTRRISQGMESPTVKQFSVPTSYVQELRRSAVFESEVHLFPDAPIRVDTAFPDQFGIRPQHFQRLQEVIVPNSGRIGW